MPSPLVVKIPHALGKAEATRRIDNGVAQARSILPAVVTLAETGKGEGVRSLSIHALGQTATALITIEDAYVVVEASVPIFLAPFSAKAKSLTEAFATKLLAGPSAGKPPSGGA